MQSNLPAPRSIFNIVVNCFTLIFFSLISVSSFSQTNYSALYTSANFVKTIDLSRPVGVVAGEPGTTASGGVTYSIPIYTPPGTNGVEPSVNITYNSQGGPGIVGYGWSIGGLSVISRSGKNVYHNGYVKPVTYTADDAFLLDGMRLNAVVGANGANLTEYHGEAESFSVVVSYTSGSPDNPDWFLVTAKDGSKIEFGHTTDSRILTNDGLKVMLWRLNRILDVNGNYVDFKYDNTSRDTRIDEINYTGNINTGLVAYNKIKFNYGNRNESNTAYDGGASLSSSYLLNNIVVTHTNDGNIVEQVKKYQFNYGFDNVHSLLKEVEEYGTDNSELNSTIFLYGDPPLNVSSFTSNFLPTIGTDVIPGDFNADGLSDAIEANYTIDPYGVKRHTSYTVFSDFNNGNGASIIYSYTLPGNAILGGSPNKLFNFFSSDYNRDGRDDVLFFAGSEVEYGQTFVLDQVILNKTTTQNSNGYQTDQFVIPAGYYWTSTAEKFFTTGDFDGDGNQDYILITNARCNGQTCGYKAFFTSPATGEINLEILNFGVGQNTNPPFYAKSVAQAKSIIPIDFDGDGKLELFVIRDEGSYVLSIDRTAPSTGYSFAGTVLQTNQNVVQNAIVYPGDFNGDRKTDLLFHNIYNNWGILYSDGKAFQVQGFTFNQTVAGNGNDVTDKIMVADFNGDGKSDIIHGYNNSSSTSMLSVYYSKGVSGNTLQYYFQQYSYNKVIPVSQAAAVIGDFNGDGISDFIYRYPSNSDFIKIKPFGKERLLQKVTDGHNNTTTFDYKLMTDKLVYPFVYNRTVSLDDPANQNPFNYVQLPMYLVAGVTVPDGLGGTQTTGFFYENAIVHRQAKGFLGFKKVTSVNSVMGMTSITESEINTQWALPYITKQKNIRNANNSLTSETVITNSFVNLSTGSNDTRYFQKIDKTLSTDYLNNQGSESVNTYDSYGNITTNVSKTGEPSGTTVNAVETTTTITNYGVHNTPVPAKPDNVTVSNIRTGTSAISATSAFTYTSNGNLATQTTFSGLPLAVTTTNVYNNFGNLTQAATSASGVVTKYLDLTYDTKGRFPVTKTSSGAGLSQTESFGYSTKWGGVLWQYSSDCLTTYYGYDAYGRMNGTITPQNISISQSFAWDIQGQQLFYKLTHFSGGSPDSKTWVDYLGREIRTETAGFGGQWVKQLTTYDTRGRLATKTNTYYPSETPLVTTTTYDDYNRPVSVSNTLNTITSTYTNLTAGKVQVTTQNSAGQTQSKITDAAGKTISAIDNGGQLDYTYDSRGNQLNVKHGTTTMTTSVYDVYGRQTSLADNDRGTTTYQYNAYGQLVQETNANGNTYTMAYDGLGKISTRTGPEGTTTFEYFPTGDCFVNKLKKITGFNGITKEYTYDAGYRDQLATEAVTVDGQLHTTYFTYDVYGHLTSTLYPGSVIVNRSYDNNGNLLTIAGGSNTSPVTIFTANAENGYGQYTSYTLGNGLTTQSTYYYGIPTRYYTPYVQDLNLSWDYTRGNLLSRNDAIKGKTENFTYDNLDRLTSSTVNGVQQFSMNYDGSTSFSMGNIMSKTDAGNYVYSTQKIHAVNYITNPAGSTAPPISHPQTLQQISYTPFLKTASITEGVYQKNFTYGPDYERIKMEIIEPSVQQVIKYKYYFGEYEKRTQSNSTTAKFVYYVSNGRNLVAIMERSGTPPKYSSGAVIIHYVHTDHLGSLLTLTDQSGAVEAEQNFDAWGRYRNINTWQYEAQGYIPPTAFNERGYTGHEHLPTHYLINMNGRMYDPIMGRMLSPDNYVPDPSHTQGYNRYSYCKNNPLKFTDPDGNFPWLIAAAALYSGISRGIASANSGMGFWQGFSSGIAIGGGTAAIGGGISSALAGSFTNLGMVGGGFVSGSISGSITGAINSLATGGNIFNGAFKGGLFGGLFGALEGALRRLSISNSQFQGDEYDRDRNVFYKSQDEMEEEINSKNGNIDKLKRDFDVQKFVLASKTNLPDDYGLIDNKIYEISTKSYSWAMTTKKGGWFTKLQSTIWISPGLKGLSSNGLGLSTMIINHELIHAWINMWAYSFYKDLDVKHYQSELSAWQYTLEYGRFHHLPSVISKAQEGIKYFSSMPGVVNGLYYWRLAPGSANWGIR
ncbi:MAG: FG-GAP-like repeat-containing protein [Chitinophagaceae bacterium]